MYAKNSRSGKVTTEIRGEIEDARRKIRIKPPKDTNLSAAQILFDPLGRRTGS